MACSVAGQIVLLLIHIIITLCVQPFNATITFINKISIRNMTWVSVIWPLIKCSTWIIGMIFYLDYLQEGILQDMALIFSGFLIFRCILHTLYTFFNSQCTSAQKLKGKSHIREKFGNAAFERAMYFCTETQSRKEKSRASRQKRASVFMT